MRATLEKSYENWTGSTVWAVAHSGVIYTDRHNA